MEQRQDEQREIGIFEKVVKIYLNQFQKMHPPLFTRIKGADEMHISTKMIEAEAGC